MGAMFLGTFRFMFPVAGAWTPLLILLVWPLTFSIGMVWLVLLVLAMVVFPFFLMAKYL